MRAIGTVLVMVAGSSTAFAVTTVGADLSSTGTPFNPGVRGTAVPSINSTRGGTTVGNPKSLEASVGSSIRGVWRARGGRARLADAEL